MRIALDATYSLGPELSGVGVYSRELIAGLTRGHAETRFQLCYRPRRYWASWRETLPANAGRRLLQEPIGPRTADLFHGLNQRLPRMRLRRSVCTFHDLFVLTGEYSTPEFRRRFAGQAREAAARADAIIAVSQFTAGQVCELLNFDRGRIYVVHHGVRAPAAAGGARENIVLHVGAIQKRKNIARLVTAFESVSSAWELALAGGGGYGAEEILRHIERSSCRHRVRVLGYVPPDELARWYGRASVFAFPSLDEGFGMPVLEAMSAGLPVVTSDRSALPEVAGDAALLVNPEDTSALAQALVSLTEDEGLRKRLAARGRERAAGFTWAEAAGRTWEVYRRVV